MKCGSEGCTDLAYARWAVAVQDGTVTLTMVQGTFLLCRSHDEWYQARQMWMSAFRIGRLEDEMCHHSPHQRRMRGGV